MKNFRQSLAEALMLPILAAFFLIILVLYPFLRIFRKFRIRPGSVELPDNAEKAVQ